jgi:hypothetical protein
LAVDPTTFESSPFVTLPSATAIKTITTFAQVRFAAWVIVDLLT